jgi:hypothetical protein
MRIELLFTFASLYSVALGSMLCDGCRPLHLLAGPGVGLDLSADYGYNSAGLGQI